MIPQTVPKRPMKGVAEAVVARNCRRRVSRVASTPAARCSARSMAGRLRTKRRPGSPGATSRPSRTCWSSSA
ncbi:MAG: hypothetical protein ACM3JH_10735 [Acidithiobacillales bacterium]